MKKESRKIQRFAVQLPCRLSNDEGMSQGTVLNLSAQGCAVTAENLPSISTYVSLEVDLLSGEASIHIELAAVRGVYERRCGLEFIRIQPGMLMNLRAFTRVLT
ncbi:MAG: hypothetical protein A4E19_02695 [Nitrospira sp. SG-bin1]|nr:MAG: hypothetical protein A4E19_02695 [Nitrospira sp. SG-bin1]